MSEERQPWNKDPEPVTEAALKRLFDQLEERALAREQRLKVFLILVPLIWGAIGAVILFLMRS